jgi:iron complex outermembrane recepter protein
MLPTRTPRRARRTALPAAVAAAAIAMAATPAAAQPAAESAQAGVQRLTVTGTRIKSLALSATSPVVQFNSDQIGLLRAATVEDFSSQLPQLAGGVNGSTARSDGFGAQTLDLRGLGQNRTLVLINGSRAVPFSFRNAVDVNSIPATLIERVDVLTGGASAVYGADAMAGVVNFVLKERFDGLALQGSARRAGGGAEQTSASITVGTPLARGNVIGYFELTDRKALLAGERSWALANGVAVAGAGGNFTDVASGRIFAVGAGDTVTPVTASTLQTTNYTPQYTLVQPLTRFNAALFVRHPLAGSVEAYGRLMLSDLKTLGAPTSGTGQAPAVINQRYLINQTNPFIPAAARAQLTFVNGVADVNVNRSLGELGVRTAENRRRTTQAQIGLRGELFEGIEWEAYTQQGESRERITILGEGRRLTALSNAWINSVDIFGPGADLSSIAQSYLLEGRTRTQDVTVATLSGDSRAAFSLPAGPIGFALGVERRTEVGEFELASDIGQSFNQAAPARPAAPPKLRASELFGEIQLPLLARLPGVKRLALEAALRRSDYRKSVGADQSHDTDKIGLSWAVSDDLLVRAARQNVLRDPNFGEWANPVGSIPFANLVTNPALRPRYQGDPCALGTGNVAQCNRLAPGLQPYDSLAAANLGGGYFFGGNPAVGPEKGETVTLGLVLTPRFLPGLSATVDYYRIRIRDAVGVIQPIDALSSCYITDPRADNPLCAAVTRDAATGRIKDGLVTDRNLAKIEQEGIDLDLRWRQRNAFGLAGHTLSIEALVSWVRDYQIQRNAVLAPIDCKATYGTRCSSDGVSLVAPDYRHRLALGWALPNLRTQLGWKRIGRVADSAVGSSGSIAAQDRFDLNLQWATPIKGLTLSAGIDNLLDKAPPTPVNAGAFNTFSDTYDVVGRSVGVSASLRF